MANKGILTVVLLFVVGCIYWFAIRESEEDRIRQPFYQLENLVTESGGPGLMGKARVVQTLRRIFQPQVVLETPTAPISGIYSPDELAGAYLSLTEAGAELELSFRNFQIQSITDNRAIVQTRVHASIERPGGRKETRGAQISVTLEKDDNGDWRFDHFREESR